MPGRGLGWLANAVAVVWLGAYLAWSELELRNLEPVVAAEPVKVRARPEPAPEARKEVVEAKAQPPRKAKPKPKSNPQSQSQSQSKAEAKAQSKAGAKSEPEAKPKPEPQQAEAPKPPSPPNISVPTHTPQRVGASELAVGRAVLDGQAPFPVLSAGYREFRSFRNYARAMSALGARFVVVRDRSIVGSADIERGELAEIDAAGELGGFSPRARSYSDEPGLAPLLGRARARFGRDASVAMLLPRQLDAGLFGGIARALGAIGESTDGFHEIRGRYEPGPGGTAWFRVEAALRKEGGQVALDLVFDLQQIARSHAAPGAA